MQQLPKMVFIIYEELGEGEKNSSAKSREHLHDKD